MIRLSVRKKLLLAEGASDLIIDTELPKGSFTALYGPSGAGKTTLLNIIAGLVQPEEGIIEVNGKIWLNTHRKINLTPQQRDTGFLFQEYALFPNMTVKQNLMFAVSKTATSQDIENMLALMQLEKLADLKPSVLSGGQQQRVALARVILKRPQLLLLDEPLSALGNELRLELRARLLEFHKRYHFTSILVSHDVSEVYQLASYVLHIQQGRVVAQGGPTNVFGSDGSGPLQLIGEVISVHEDRIAVFIHSKIIELPVEKTGSQSLKPGEKVTLLCNPADLTIQKLF